MHITAVPVETNLLALTGFEVMVTAVLDVPSAVNVVCAGLKLHDIPTGSPEQVSETLPAMPDSDCTWTVTGEEAAP